MKPQARIHYIFTTFPKASETFLQREVSAMQVLGADLRLSSMWKGGDAFGNMPVDRFRWWELGHVLWLLPWLALRNPGLLGQLCGGVLTRPAPSWENLGENLLGAGFAAVRFLRLRRDPPDAFHAAWSGGPATAAYVLSRLLGVPFSVGAHAYDIYEHGGDWWLGEKLRAAAWVHTSTEMARETLITRGIPADKIHRIYRGLTKLPPMATVTQRTWGQPLRVLCVARLVEKKGWPQQVAIYAAMRDAGLSFAARIIGEGPERDSLVASLAEAGLAEHVTLSGACPNAEVWAALAESDVLMHTGIVAASGDRDGLPNVLAEAMAAGVLVLTSSAAATREAIADGLTGRVLLVDEPTAWVAAIHELARNPAQRQRLRHAARAWVETNFDATRNASQLLALMRGGIGDASPSKP